MNVVNNFIVLTLLSYILGHLISYLSSLSVEQFSIWRYGYPSDYLLKEVNKGYLAIGVEVNKVFFIRLLWRVIIAIFLLPLVLGDYLFSRRLCVNLFFIKRLDENLVDAINEKCKYLATYLYCKFDYKESDFHRIIQHYEYEHQPLHANKMDNYVALYGFLRSMTFVFNVLFLYILLFNVFPNIDFNAAINWKMVLLLAILICLTYLFFMGFMKFYRRYTLESFMCLLIDNSYINEDIIKKTDKMKLLVSHTITVEEV